MYRDDDTEKPRARLDVRSLPWQYQSHAVGIKTRCIETMVQEVICTFETHRANGSIMGGRHLEQTAEFVTDLLRGGFDDELPRSL